MNPLRSTLGLLLASIPLCVLAPAARAAAAPQQLSLSEPIEELERRLAVPPSGARAVPIQLVLDRPSLDPREAHALLMAIADLRLAGGSVVAICPRPSAAAAGSPDRGGVAIVALACDALVFEAGASLRGAQPGWCPSAARRIDLAATLAELGRIDQVLANRIVDCTTPLSWSSRTGFAPYSRDRVELAAANEPLALSASMLRSVGMPAQEFASVTDAIAAIAAGSVVPRAAAAPVGAPPSPPAGSPAPPAGRVAEVPQTLDPEVQAKVDAKAEEYEDILDELKRSLDDFNEHFHGRRGVWNTANRSLKDVWRDKSDNTRDSATKLRCERLQRDMKEHISSLGRISKAVDRLVKDDKHPLVVRFKANQEELEGLRVALDRNKVDDYEKYFPKVEKLK